MSLILRNKMTALKIIIQVILIFLALILGRFIGYNYGRIAVIIVFVIILAINFIHNKNKK
jgi:hypothetical protein